MEVSCEARLGQMECECACFYVSCLFELMILSLLNFTLLELQFLIYKINEL